MSAHPHAAFERPAPHVGITRSAATGAARLAEIREETAARAVAKCWPAMDLSVRIVLVMLGCGQAGKPERIAQQPWESFSASDQQAMAIAARKVRACLADFAAVA